MEPTVIVKVADEPFLTVAAFGDMANEKSCGATTFKVTFVMRLCEPEVPVMLSA